MCWYNGIYDYNDNDEWINKKKNGILGIYVFFFWFMCYANSMPKLIKLK